MAALPSGITNPVASKSAQSIANDDAKPAYIRFNEQGDAIEGNRIDEQIHPYSVIKMAALAALYEKKGPEFFQKNHEKISKIISGSENSFQILCQQAGIGPKATNKWIGNAIGPNNTNVTGVVGSGTSTLRDQAKIMAYLHEHYPQFTQYTEGTYNSWLKDNLPSDIAQQLGDSGGMGKDPTAIAKIGHVPNNAYIWAVSGKDGGFIAHDKNQAILAKISTEQGEKVMQTPHTSAPVITQKSHDTLPPLKLSLHPHAPKRHIENAYRLLGMDEQERDNFRKKHQLNNQGSELEALRGEIRKVQEALVQNGIKLHQYGIDGLAGDETFRAVIRYRQEHGTDPDVLKALREQHQAKDTTIPSISVRAENTHSSPGQIQNATLAALKPANLPSLQAAESGVEEATTASPVTPPKSTQAQQAPKPSRIT